jgi:hypothetical protein
VCSGESALREREREEREKEETAHLPASLLVLDAGHAAKNIFF